MRPEPPSAPPAGQTAQPQAGSTKAKYPILFLDDWPRPPSACPNNNNNNNNINDQAQQPALARQVKKMQLQTLLALNPWGIPLAALPQAYEQMFARPLDVKEMGHEHVAEMVAHMADIFAVGQPDEFSALMFPGHPDDRVLHDARLYRRQSPPPGQRLDKPDLQHYHNSAGSPQPAAGPQPDGRPFSGPPAATSVEPVASSEAAAAAAAADNPGALDYKTTDPETLITQAWINRDDDFPADVALPGEQYSEPILPLTKAQVPQTRGVHRATIVSASSPDNVYVVLQSSYADRIETLSAEIRAYFESRPNCISMYSVPDEFIYPGFPCLVYMLEDQSWERCSIIAKSGSKKNRVLVETIDFGGVRSVNKIYLYLVPKHLLDIPRQAILVSLAGIKPPDEAPKWSASTSKRLRCFSIPGYWLDCLLIPHKHYQQQQQQQQSQQQQHLHLPQAQIDVAADKTIPDDHQATLCSPTGAPVPTSAAQSAAQSTFDKQLLPSLKKLKWHKKPEFEVLICDRNDDQMDLYVHELLVLETHAIFDPARNLEIKTYRDQFNMALSNLARPQNPLTSISVSPDSDVTHTHTTRPLIAES